MATDYAIALVGTLCHNGHAMEIQRNGDLYELRPDQTVTITEDGARVDYEYISCNNDCADIPTAITSMAFEIAFNGVTCRCEHDVNHYRTCSLYRPASTATLELRLFQPGHRLQLTVSLNGDNNEPGHDLPADFKTALAASDGNLDDVTRLLRERYGWYLTIEPLAAS